MGVLDDRDQRREPRFPAERLVTQWTPHERGLAAAALAAFLGITCFGPALTRVMTPKSRVRRLREAAEKKARRLRRGVRKVRGHGPSFSRVREKEV